MVRVRSRVQSSLTAPFFPFKVQKLSVISGLIDFGAAPRCETTALQMSRPHKNKHGVYDFCQWVPTQQLQHPHCPHRTRHALSHGGTVPPCLRPNAQRDPGRTPQQGVVCFPDPARRARAHRNPDSRYPAPQSPRTRLGRGARDLGKHGINGKKNTGRAGLLNMMGRGHTAAKIGQTATPPLSGITFNAPPMQCG